MVNQGSKGVRTILWYSLCEERGIFGDSASNMSKYLYVPCTQHYATHHGTEDHYNAIVSHNNPLARTTIICLSHGVTVTVLFFFGKQKWGYASISKFPEFPIGTALVNLSYSILSL